MKQRSCIVVSVHKTMQSKTASLMDCSEEPFLGARKGKCFFLVCQDASHQVNFSLLDFPVTQGTQLDLLRNVLRKVAKDIMLQQPCQVTTKSNTSSVLNSQANIMESQPPPPPLRGEQQANSYNAQ